MSNSSTKVGSVLILRRIPITLGETPSYVQYENVTSEFQGDNYNSPSLEGTFIEVEVMRNFRVASKSELTIDELD